MSASPLSPSQRRRLNWLRARLIKLELADGKRGLSRAEHERYDKYATEYEALVEADQAASVDSPSVPVSVRRAA